MRANRDSTSKLPRWAEWGSLVVAIPLAALVVSGSHGGPPPAREAFAHEESCSSLEAARTRLERHFDEAYLKLRVISLRRDTIAMSRDHRGPIHVSLDHDRQTQHFSEVRVIGRKAGPRPLPRQSQTHQVVSMHTPVLENDTSPTRSGHLQRFVKDPTLDSLLSGPAGHQTTEPRIVLSVPVRSDGELIGIVCGTILLDEVLKTFRRAAGNHQVILASERGDVLGNADLALDTLAWFETEFRTAGVSRFSENCRDRFRIGCSSAVWRSLKIPGDLNWYVAMVYDEARDDPVDRLAAGPEDDNERG